MRRGGDRHATQRGRCLAAGPAWLRAAIAGRRTPAPTSPAAAAASRTPSAGRRAGDRRDPAPVRAVHARERRRRPVRTRHGGQSGGLVSDRRARAGRARQGRRPEKSRRPGGVPASTPPNGGEPPEQPTRELQEQMLEFAQCMREQRRPTSPTRSRRRHAVSVGRLRVGPNGRQEVRGRPRRSARAELTMAGAARGAGRIGGRPVTPRRAGPPAAVVGGRCAVAAAAAASACYGGPAAERRDADRPARTGDGRRRQDRRSTETDRGGRHARLRRQPATCRTAAGAGTVTWLPAPGATVDRGAERCTGSTTGRWCCCTATCRPTGRSRPATEGADVKQLEENLARSATPGSPSTTSTPSTTADGGAGVAGGPRAGRDRHASSSAGSSSPPAAVRVADAQRAGRRPGRPAPVLDVTGTTRVVTVDAGRRRPAAGRARAPR